MNWKNLLRAAGQRGEGGDRSWRRAAGIAYYFRGHGVSLRDVGEQWNLLGVRSRSVQGKSLKCSTIQCAPEKRRGISGVETVAGKCRAACLCFEGFPSAERPADKPDRRVSVYFFATVCRCRRPPLIHWRARGAARFFCTSVSLDHASGESPQTAGREPWKHAFAVPCFNRFSHNRLFLPRASHSSP